MDPNTNENLQPEMPRRRRKRTKWQNFKEAYLPVIIIAVAVILIIVFIAGSISRAGAGKETEQTQPSESMLDAASLLQQEAEQLMAQAEVLAAGYDYSGAVSLLDTFSGDMTTIEGMVAKYNEYKAAFDALIPYTDVENVPMLSFNTLIPNLSRALANETYGDSFNSNYVTTDEFSAILQQLYDNGYMLVSLYDLAPKTVDEAGNVTISEGNLFLPEGKKPIVLIQTGMNYTYMVDGDGDGLADKDGAGFASRLVLDSNGELTCELVDAEGNTVTGAYDLIPILEDFIEQHPDFSYHGARAVIAVNGYDGLFGYRTDPETAEKISTEYYNQQLTQVKPIIEAVRNAGYDIACFTYDHCAYGNMEATAIDADLKLWKDEVLPLLGDVDILVYPYGSDIGDTGVYSGSKYETLKSYGFSYFVTQDPSTASWGQITSSYARFCRRQVTGSLMNYAYTYYEDLFDSQSVLNPNRGEIPG